jgi:hypothetical protein
MDDGSASTERRDGFLLFDRGSRYHTSRIRTELLCDGSVAAR